MYILLRVVISKLRQSISKAFEFLQEFLYLFKNLLRVFAIRTLLRAVEYILRPHE